MKKYLIKKGQHNSGFHLGIHFKKEIVMKREVIFKENCKYDLNGIDQSDVNKLFGVSFGLHQKNSARFGWRWSLDKNKIEILTYTYINGVRNFDSLQFVDLEETITLTLEAKADTYCFKFGTSELTIKKSNTPSYGYFLYPYFGGNQMAPHDINIFIDSL